MSLKRYAAIDIGSNTILLLIGRIISEGIFDTVLDTGETTRLGRGLQKGGALNPQSVQATIDCLKRFYALCKREGVEEIAAVGTNALRLARDADQFIQRVHQECGISLRVINETDEAILSLISVKNDSLMPHDAVIIDVGGGSTEYIFRSGEGASHLLETISLPLGAVALTEQFFHHDPPTGKECLALRKKVENMLQKIPSELEGEIVGIGGTATALGLIHLGQDTFERARIHGMILTINKLSEQINDLQKKDLVTRKMITGLPSERADIILAGAMIIISSMHRLKKERIHISCGGLRYGLFYNRFMDSNKNIIGG